MEVLTSKFCLVFPDKWQGVAEAKSSRGTVVIRELMEEDSAYSGIVATLKTSRRRLPVSDTCEYLGALVSPSCGTFYLYAIYGEEGSCSEDCSDLYWRVFDGLPPVFASITPLGDFSWQPA